MNQSKSQIAHPDRYSILGISEQNFAVEITNVKEVIPLPKITPVPNVHESIIGVFNLRGQIHSILDLRVLLKLEINDISDKNFIVLIEWEEFKFGVIVDRVLDVMQLESSKIQIPTRELSLPYVQYLNGYCEIKKLGNIYMLDLAAILQSKEIIRYRYL